MRVLEWDPRVPSSSTWGSWKVPQWDYSLDCKVAKKRSPAPMQGSLITLLWCKHSTMAKGRPGFPQISVLGPILTYWNGVVCRSTQVSAVFVPMRRKIFVSPYPVRTCKLLRLMWDSIGPRTEIRVYLSPWYCWYVIRWCGGLQVISGFYRFWQI